MLLQHSFLFHKKVVSMFVVFTYNRYLVYHPQIIAIPLFALLSTIPYQKPRPSHAERGKKKHRQKSRDKEVKTELCWYDHHHSSFCLDSLNKTFNFQIRAVSLH